MLSACGSDSSGAGKPDGMDGGALEQDDGGGTQVDGGEIQLDGGATSAPTKCDEGEQDRDGDGVCQEACSAAIECGAGECDDYTGTARCVCPDGVAGEACDECAHGYAGEDCKSCAPGFLAEGDSCIEDACAELLCGDHGSCVHDGSLVRCECDQGFTGKLCGGCADGYDGAACDVCAAGFTMVPDEGCVPDVCVGHSCGQFGTCVDDGGAPKCECNDGHQGDTCDSCKPGYYPSIATGICHLIPPPTLHDDLLLWQDADDRTTFFLNGNEGVIAWQSKAPANTSAFTFPLTSTQKLSEDGERTRLVFSGGDYAHRTFSMANPSYTLYIVAKWQSDAEAGGNAPSQGILAGTDLTGALGHGLWYEARSDSEIRYRHRFPFGGGGAAVGDEVYGDLYDANQGLQLIVSQRGITNGGYLRLYNGDSYTELSPLTKDAFAEDMRLHLGVNGPSGAGALEGEIAEILIYKHAQSTPTRKAVEAYLRAKWKLPEPPAPKL